MRGCVAAAVALLLLLLLAGPAAARVPDNCCAFSGVFTEGSFTLEKLSIVADAITAVIGRNATRGATLVSTAPTGVGHNEVAALLYYLDDASGTRAGVALGTWLVHDGDAQQSLTHVLGENGVLLRSVDVVSRDLTPPPSETPRPPSGPKGGFIPTLSVTTSWVVVGVGATVVAVGILGGVVATRRAKRRKLLANIAPLMDAVLRESEGQRDDGVESDVVN